MTHSNEHSWRNGQRKITADLTREARKLHTRGYGTRTIALLLGVSRPTVVKMLKDASR